MQEGAGQIFELWYERQGWTSFPFQKETAEAMLSGQNGLLNAPTGSGKTYACFLPVLIRWMLEHLQFKLG